MCRQNMDRATTRDNTGQKTKDTPIHRREIKISDSAGNRIRAIELEVRDSTNRAMATDTCEGYFFKVRSVAKLEPQQESHEALRKCVAQCL